MEPVLLLIEGIQFSVDQFFESLFVKIGILSIFFYQMVPSIFKLLGTGGILVRLLDAGISPVFIIVVHVAGWVAGQYMLYLLGRYAYKLFKKRKRELLTADHWLHKYRHVIFLAIPFTSTLGELLLVFSGHQRIGFQKILPFLIIGDTARISIYVAWTLGQISLPEILQ